MQLALGQLVLLHQPRALRLVDVCALEDLLDVVDLGLERAEDGAGVHRDRVRASASTGTSARGARARILIGAALPLWRMLLLLLGICIALLLLHLGWSRTPDHPTAWP